MNITAIYILFIGILLIPFPILGQGNSNFHFKKLQVVDGLSENAVYSIFQDQEGFMWFGTKDGLNRYDGSSFKIYRHQADDKLSIGNNFIRSLTQADKNNLYVGTDAGIYIMDKVTESFSKLQLKASDNSTITSAINALLTDRDGHIWIATMAQGIYQYTPKTAQLRKVPVEDFDLGTTPIWSVFEDKSGTIWVGTRLGLLRYNASSSKLEIAAPSIFSKTGSYDNEILSILEDNIGNLWLGTWSEGLKCYNKQSNSYTSYLHHQSKYVTHIRSIFQYSEKQFLIGSDDGLYLFHTDTEATHRIDIPQFKYSLSDQNVYSIAMDKEGGIWIGTYFGGINYLNSTLLAVETYYPDLMHGFLSGKAVSQFCEDPQGNLWIATEDGGLNYFDVKTKLLSQPIKTSYHNTHALLLDEDNLWIGTFSRGIDVYNTKTKQIVNYRFKFNESSTINDDCIFSLYKTKSGDIYIGTPVGLNKFDRQKREFVRVEGIHGFIYDIKEDDAGNIWLASYGSGAIKFDHKQQRWIHYDRVKKDDPIAGSKLTSIYIDSRKRLIFTSEGKGIFIYDQKKDSFHNISESDGLPNGVIYGVLDDPLGNLWLSSNKGLICVNTDRPDQYRLYDIENGMQSNQFNYKSTYKAKDGKFYVGGINGFNSFYPQELNKLKNQISPPVAITKIQFLNGSDEKTENEIQTLLNKKELIKLNHSSSSFTISFVSLSFISPSQNQYAYKLEGADANWTYAGNNKNVTYVNLRPGKYTFKVKASNNDGLWNEEGSEISIEILPPFWLSLPAKIFYMLAALSVAFLLISYYIKRNKIKQTRQLESFKAEQATRSFKSKIEFFTNIAHEIRTPLSLISAPLEEIISKDEGSDLTKTNLNIIEKNCERLRILINQLLDFRKMDTIEYKLYPERIEIKEYLREMHERFKKAAQKKKLQFDIRLPREKNLYVLSDMDALTKIVSNLLTNALKFAHSKIVMRLRHNPDHSFTISVEDDGQGIPDEYKNLIFDPFYQVKSGRDNNGAGIGLSLVKHLSNLLKGKIEIVDGQHTGALFMFTFSDMQKFPVHTVKEQENLTETTLYPTIEQTDTHILIVEDNPDMTSFICGCLQEHYHVDTAEDTSLALELLEEKNYHLIISDIMMPGIDGISFVKKIKTDVSYSHIPVILLSAKIENSTKAEGLMSGADVFIEKPFSTLFLKAQISSLLKNRKTLLDIFNRSPLASYSLLATNKSDECFINKLNQEIEKHISDEKFSVESLAETMHISRSNLQRKLKAISGSSPGDYLRNYRLKKASLLLVESDIRINEVAFQVGFNSASYLRRHFTNAITFHRRSLSTSIQKTKQQLSDAVANDYSNR